MTLHATHRLYSLHTDQGMCIAWGFFRIQGPGDEFVTLIVFHARNYGASTNETTDMKQNIIE